MAVTQTIGTDTEVKKRVNLHVHVQTFFKLEECPTVINDLEQCGCCARCILRLIGVKRQSAYIKPQEVLSTLLDRPDDNPTPGDSLPVPDDGMPQDVTPKKSPGRVCTICLGILQDLCDESYVDVLVKQVREADFGFDDFTLSMTQPLQLLLREHCIWLHLRTMFSKLYLKAIHGVIATIKEVYKWVCGPIIGDALEVNFHFKSPMEIMITFVHAETEKELRTLLRQTEDGEPARKRRKGQQFHSPTPSAPGKQLVLSAIKNLPKSSFKELFACPPTIPETSCNAEVTCFYSAVFVAGRYNKYSRNLSQTPWLIAGERKTESSIQEIICEPIKELLKATDYRFSASGREDVDVRTLGRGRPFVVEVINARRPMPTLEEFSTLRKTINKSTTDARVRDLQGISRESTNKLKAGEQIKTKSYSALVWSSVEQNTDSLSFLADIKDMTLHQKTPIRVLHRRPLATRPRIVHSISAQPIDQHHFRLILRTQAGTYIKEFVHGDFGRTLPNLGTLLKCEVDILELDVESVDVDWPPSIPEEEAEPTVKEGSVQDGKELPEQSITVTPT